jgi:tetratricopeptide (TPR) repeat protein
MDQARVLRVVVASPGDVAAEREAVVRAAEEVNRNIGRDRGLRLEVYRWETEAHPGLHADGPQGIIDPVLRIDDCDLLIGIFWKHFGTPTTDAQSGTEHEFRLAYEAWKKNQRPQVMVYFNEAPYAPKSRKETDQWGRVLDFKENFPEEGLWWPYDGHQQFENRVRDHLSKFVRSFGSLETSKPPVVQVSLAPNLTALHSLPPPPADFTGREAELAELRAAIEDGGVTISGLQGQGGVGKTALALKLAEELSPNYPDAQIYLDLKGVSRTEAGDRPLTAAEAIAYVIRACHPDFKLPENEAELKGIYFNLLRGKRALLVMDNARDKAQVEPLIPPTCCTLLVTSRTHFTLPGLKSKNLETLPPDDAEKLLLEIDKRIDGEAGKIARLCGYLPLALRLAGSTLTECPDLAPSDYARRLEKELLKVLTESEASIGLSYTLLDAAMQKRWRTLGVFRDTFDTPAAAALWEMETDSAQDALSRLRQCSMLEWNETSRRYRLHELMRDFARARLQDAGEEDEAARRHAMHYVDVLGQADGLYRQGGVSIKPGLALFDLEWGNVQAGQAWAAGNAERDDESARLCNRYSDAGAYCLNLRLHAREQIRWREAALTAARRLKDRGAEGAHLGNLGLAYSSQCEYGRAAGYYEKALALAREIGDRWGEGATLGNLGVVCSSQGEYRRAIDYHEQHLATAREIGDRRGEGTALGNLGLVYHRLGKFGRAIEYHEQHLVIARDIGDRRGEGRALGNLGLAYNSLGKFGRAIEYQEARLAIAREIGDRLGEGQALGNLSLAHQELGEYRRAIEYLEQVMAIMREIGDRQGEGSTLGNLGNVYGSLGDHQGAIEYYQQQLAITREIGDRRGEGSALFNMSLALDKIGNRPNAVEHAGAALKIFEQIEDPGAASVSKQLEEWRGSGDRDIEPSGN